jgi:hypothetical protein
MDKAVSVAQHEVATVIGHGHVLHAELKVTDLGQCLVTTAEQTVLDLAHRPNLGQVAQEADAAIRAEGPGTSCEPAWRG